MDRTLISVLFNILKFEALMSGCIGRELPAAAGEGRRTKDIQWLVTDGDKRGCGEWVVVVCEFDRAAHTHTHTHAWIFYTGLLVSCFRNSHFRFFFLNFLLDVRTYVRLRSLAFATCGWVCVCVCPCVCVCLCVATPIWLSLASGLAFCPFLPTAFPRSLSLCPLAKNNESVKRLSVSLFGLFDNISAHVCVCVIYANTCAVQFFIHFLSHNFLLFEIVLQFSKYQLKRLANRWRCGLIKRMQKKE